MAGRKVRTPQDRLPMFVAWDPVAMRGWKVPQKRYRLSALFELRKAGQFEKSRKWLARHSSQSVDG